MNINEFFNTDFTSFSTYASFRGIGNFIDGQKPSSRKVLYSAKSLKDKTKVASLAARIVDTCLHPDTEIFVNGELIKVSTLEGREFDIISFNTDTNSFEDDICLNVFISKYTNDFIKIETENGQIIQVTPEHKILTTNGWVEAKDLTENDNIISLYD